MSIYHLHASPISRSAGRSATASAAYRSAELVVDERTRETFDYRRKSGVLEKGILAPEEAPSWVHDRARLWNESEKAETRINSRTAREVRLALPEELSVEANKSLVEDYIKRNFVYRGMVADYAIHAPSSAGDERNVHVHILLTTREIGPEGFEGKRRDWDKVESLVAWRKDWSETVNRELEHKGIEARIDHRTLKAQGIDREPTTHRGPEYKNIDRVLDALVELKIDTLKEALNDYDRERETGKNPGREREPNEATADRVGSQQEQPNRGSEAEPDREGPGGTGQYMSDLERQNIGALINLGKAEQRAALERLSNIERAREELERQRSEKERGGRERSRGMGR